MTAVMFAGEHITDAFSAWAASRRSRTEDAVAAPAGRSDRFLGLCAGAMALEGGTGSELRNPLGVTIIGVLLLSQLLTLYTTPVIYLAMERVRARLALSVSGARCTTNSTCTEIHQISPATGAPAPSKLDSIAHSPSK